MNSRKKSARQTLKSHQNKLYGKELAKSSIMHLSLIYPFLREGVKKIDFLGDMSPKL